MSRAKSAHPIRVSEGSHKTLGAMAIQLGISMQEVADLAIEQFRRRTILEETNRAYAALRADANVWAEIQAERSDWEATIADGLD